MTDVPRALRPHPPFDRQLDGPLREILRTLPTPLTPELIPARREVALRNRLSDDDIRRGGAFTVIERTVPGPTGSPDISLLICRPTATPGPYPVLYNTHGGGMVGGHNRTTELAGELARAQELGMAVVAVEYRLAPENPYPAAVEDCYAGLRWTARNAARLNLDPDAIVVSGNSAGGGLAAAMALLARDRRGPELRGQMLQCPMLDDSCDTASAHQMERVGLWDRVSNLTGWDALLGERRGTPDVPVYAAPARESDLSGLAPAFIDVGSVESLRDEAVEYASRLWRCGGEAELHVWSGAFHSFDEWVPDAIVSRTAHTARVDWLRRVFLP